MSIDSARAYVERIKEDEEFRKKVLECKDAKERGELVRAEGFDFTAKDIEVVTAVLEDTEIERATGGGCQVTTMDISPCWWDWHPRF